MSLSVPTMEDIIRIVGPERPKTDHLKTFVVPYCREGQVEVLATDAEAAEFLVGSFSEDRLTAELGPWEVGPAREKRNSGVLAELHNGREVAR